MSNVPSRFDGRSYRFDWTKRASGKPRSTARVDASSTAAGDRSAPVTRAPSRANESVSMPKWHWRCRSERPATSPIISSS